MSTHDKDAAGNGTDVAVADSGALPERFSNPGLPPHRQRLADIDTGAAKRAERQVASLFGVSAIGTVVVIVVYFAIQVTRGQNQSFVDWLAAVQRSNLLLGLGMFLALFGIGAGAIHWAKTLMPDEERIEYRHPMRSSEEDRAATAAIFQEAGEEAGLGRRPLLRNSLFGALALAPIPGLVFLKDLGPMPKSDLSTTVWKPGTVLLRDEPNGGKIKPADLEPGSVVHVLPEGLEKTAHPLDEKAKAAVLLVRLDPKLIDDAAKAGSYEGIVAYSKICTHMGCPVALYEQQTHHLLCPCHQSTFDLTRNCEVIFGPAKRALPQLAITVDAEGYLVAKEPFHEAVGPSFWERG